MRFIISVPLWAALGLSSSAVSAQANVCEAVMTAFQVPILAQGTQGDAHLGCTREQVMMLEANSIAAAQAQPVQDPTKVEGTWLGDDVLYSVLGIMVPGQEVLRIEPSEDGSLRIEQFFFKSVVPPQSNGALWAEEGTYQGRVMTTMIERGQEEGQWRPILADPAFPAFDETTFEFGRADQLFSMQRLNHFEMPLIMGLAGDVLVLETERFEMPSRQTIERTVTYTRVDERAPDLAMMIVRSLDLSAVVHFDCLTHQLSAQDGPFFEAMVPYGRTEIDDVLREQFAVSTQVERQMAMIRGMEDPSDEDRAAMIESMKALQEMSSHPVMQVLVRVLVQDRSSGCVSPN